MKQIEVVAAIICKGGSFLASQRGYGEFEGLWEFPGGKIEMGETHEMAILREIKEELGVSINVEKFLCTTEYDYPSFHLTMHCYVCSIKSGDIVLREHKSALWLTTETFDDVEWLPADKSVVEILRQKISTLS